MIKQTYLITEDEQTDKTYILLHVRKYYNALQAVDCIVFRVKELTNNHPIGD